MRSWRAAFVRASCGRWGGPRVSAVMDTESGQSGFLADAAPEGVQSPRIEFFGRHPLRAFRTGKRRNQLRRFRPEPDGARSGLRRDRASRSPGTGRPQVWPWGPFVAGNWWGGRDSDPRGPSLQLTRATPARSARVLTFAGAARPDGTGWNGEVRGLGRMAGSVQQVGEAEVLERVAQLVVEYGVNLHRTVAGFVVPPGELA